MDTFAAIGSLVISEGATAPVVLTTNQKIEQLPPRPEVTTVERQTADAVFTTHQKSDPYVVPATLLVVSASVATLKSIAIDEQKRSEEQKSVEEVPDLGEPGREKARL
jgi:chorismate synthase